jgi:hypothetical protein
MNPEKIKRKIKIIRYIHYTILWLFFVCVGLIVFSEKLGVYAAFAIASMGVVQGRNRGDCPLTLEEHNARRQIGERTDHKFIEEVFKKHFNINISRFVINSVLAAAFGLSGYTVVVYLVNAISGF